MIIIIKDNMPIFRELTLKTDHAIARYLARCFPDQGLYGKNPLQASEVRKASKQ